MSSAWDQHGSRVRLEWGAVGAREVAIGATCVVVDVLSFTTTLSVAADRGVVVHPHPWRDDSARALADRLGATLAVGRSDQPKNHLWETRRGDSLAGHAAAPDWVSLSPGTVRAAPDLHLLVLPSPNGSSIAHLLAGSGSPVVGACLRNRDAVARHLAAALKADPFAAVALVPAGERWPDGSLRPAVEDVWGAGGVVAALLDLGVEEALLSEEARAAAAAYRLVEGRLGSALLACSSGRELAAIGYAGDVAIAAELDTSVVVPVLGPDGAFRAAAPTSIE
ncbi:2-phosphosulfolactate phosphatase [Lapillicoccus sp.]|uniref:2-phosphosulfolactate phosphatase n=1 Tax=Lapillicoccus sp. TaxID=1909287 RepID=UPI0025E8F2A2|nr:2-phosphosulfolactate phosphatase [Lapillicoccus sp.]